MLSRPILADFRAPSSSVSPLFRTIRTHRSTSLIALLTTFKSVDLPLQPLQADSGLSNDGNGGEEDGGKPKRMVEIPRQKYIPVSKAELLDAITVSMFDTAEDARQFLDVSSCLDSVIHAEHKSVLEEMRACYSVFTALAGKDGKADDEPPPKTDDKLTEDNSIKSNISENSVNSPGKRDRRQQLTLSMLITETKDMKNVTSDGTKSRVAIATRFQRAFMRLLSDAQFEEISAKDLMLVSTLNTDYLLTLPVSVDWKKAYESNAIIFRRGYTTEKQKGLLLAEKLDYIQSKLLQRIFFAISKPLAKVGSWIIETIESSHSNRGLKGWAGKTKQRLLDASYFQGSYYSVEQNSFDKLEVGSELGQELSIWVAAQRAIKRYETFLSSAGPRGRLLQKLLALTGLEPPAHESQLELKNDNSAADPYLRPISLSRISIGDIWKPAVDRWYGNDIWEALRTSISILLSQSILQEAAFQELILLYIKEVNGKDADAESGDELQLQIYKTIPIPDLPVIFPHKKLSFRIIDTVRLDVATLLGLLAYFINYKFEDILSSPSAIFFDAIAISALVLFVIRVALGYKQTWDRYQLLVNKTLYEKTVASGFGSVHFLLDASEQQKVKEAILAYALLLRANNQTNCRQRVGEECERFLYNAFKQKVEMPVDKAVDTLLRLGLVIECANGSTSIQAIPCPKAFQALKERWDVLLL